MEEQKIDRRVRKTKKQITSALVSLMLEKSLGDITVREIAERADVNRGTFYAHYKDVNDLMLKLEEEILGAFADIGRQHPPKISREVTGEYFAALLTICGENADMFRALICRNSDPAFWAKVEEGLKTQYLNEFMALNSSADAETREYFCSFIIMGLQALTKRWIEGGIKESPEEMARLAGSFIMNGVHSLN